MMLMAAAGGGSGHDESHPKDGHSHAGASWLFRGKNKLLARILCNYPIRTGSLQDVNVPNWKGLSVWKYLDISL